MMRVIQPPVAPDVNPRPGRPQDSRTPTKFKRGFGSPNYNPARAREVRQLGQRALRLAGKAHQFTKEEAAAAGRKGAARTAEILRARKEQQRVPDAEAA